jgi:mRNA interferase MazF
MKPGDLVLVSFPQADLHRGKLRPTLVVTHVPGKFSDLLVMMVTSKVHQAIADFDEIVATGHSDYAISGLKATSVIRLSRLATISSEAVQARIGRISMERHKALCERLAQWLLGIT